MKKYRHTQIGYFSITMLVIASFLLIILALNSNLSWLPLVIVLILIILLTLFSTLTIIIQNNDLWIRFGIGIIRKKFQLKDIESSKVVKNPWYYGWGIHLIPHGWIYNVSGSSAVEITMKSGKKYRLGTDAPDDLLKAINQSR